MSTLDQKLCAIDGDIIEFEPCPLLPPTTAWGGGGEIKNMVRVKFQRTMAVSSTSIPTNFCTKLQSETLLSMILSLPNRCTPEDPCF